MSDELKAELTEQDLEEAKAGLYEKDLKAESEKPTGRTITKDETREVASKTSRRDVLALGDKLRTSLGLGPKNYEKDKNVR